MSGNTTTQGYPYPLTSDFLDVQDPFRLATAVDADLRAAQDPFRQFMGRPSFIVRSTANSSGIVNGSVVLPVGAVEWDNTGGAAVGSSSWSQPPAQGPSWWLFGANLILTNTTAPTVGDMRIAELAVSTRDQASGLFTTTKFWQRNDDSNTAGEWIVVTAMAALYQGTAFMTLVANGTGTVAIASGSRMWGMYLGPVT